MAGAVLIGLEVLILYALSTFAHVIRPETLGARKAFQACERCPPGQDSEPPPSPSTMAQKPPAVMVSKKPATAPGLWGRIFGTLP
jgi:hypothetical protein